MWAARVSSPARRIKSCTYPVLPRPSSVVLCRSVRLEEAPSCCPVLSRPSGAAPSVTETVTESRAGPLVVDRSRGELLRARAGAATLAPPAARSHSSPIHHKSSTIGEALVDGGGSPPCNTDQPDPAERRGRPDAELPRLQADHCLTTHLPTCPTSQWTVLYLMH